MTKDILLKNHLNNEYLFHLDLLLDYFYKQVGVLLNERKKLIKADKEGKVYVRDSILNK